MPIPRIFICNKYYDKMRIFNSVIYNFDPKKEEEKSTTIFSKINGQLWYFGDN